MITIDCESMPIEGNPLTHPPKIIGVSIKYGDSPSRYLTNPEAMRVALASIYSSDEPMLFHNAPFDLSVIRAAFGLEFPEWDRIYDTMYSVYLKNPHAKSMALKQSSVTYLGRDPDEQDELHEWILNSKECGGATAKTAGAFIWAAQRFVPELVAKYAEADTDMTYALHQKLHTSKNYSMFAYNTERQLMPYLVAATIKGIRVDRKGLQAAAEIATEDYKEAENRIMDILGYEEDFELTNGHTLAKALDAGEFIKEEDWCYTKKGKRSTARDALVSGVKNNAELLELLIYAGALRTCLNTFMLPWLDFSEEDGRLHPNWNQVRTTHGRTKGARTGRLSSDGPNLQNVPTEFDIATPTGLHPIPLLRGYLLPEVGQQWASRDYSGQEMRILAHFAGGVLQQAFVDDPELDPHEMVRQIIHKATGRDYPRKSVKGAGFGIIYGMGATGLSKDLGIALTEAQVLIAAYLAALPEVEALQQETRQRGKRTGVSKTPVRTIGERRFYCEPKNIVDGEMRSYEYKLLNYLIQGSAADQTKRALILYFKTKPESNTFMGTVHDEINESSPIGNQAIILDRAMRNAVPDFDTPFTTTLEVGPTWGAVK